MGSYRAPTEDMRFVIDQLCRVEATLGSVPPFDELGLGSELSSTLLEESARLCAEVLAPLRRVGDTQPATCSEGKVTATPGFDEALRLLGAGGWAGITAPLEYGGQSLPEVYGTAACEMWSAADLAFSLLPILTVGAALAISAHGTDQQKATYLEKMFSGRWTGAMNLTETGAGSDLGVMKARAEAEGDHYRIYGQKIFITWGDHDAAENIVHLVLARLPGAAAGSRGISLFIVPKYLPRDDGSPGERNDVHPLSVEHKLGIHASPTCVMAFGEREGAVGHLLGGEGNGLKCMFTMMNEARLKVGLQGLGAAEGAYQLALAHARERVQGGVPIIRHADVKRMLLTMKAVTEAMRAFAYSVSLSMDQAQHQRDSVQRARVDLMIPVIKTWLTEMGQELTSLGMQIHGGMGYVEETGAAQYLRDVRITSIYEGTNGIQAADLVSRKLARDGGAAMAALLQEVADTVADCAAAGEPLAVIQMGLAASQEQVQRTTLRILEQYRENREAAMAGSFDYLMQVGYLMGAWHLARSALVAQRQLATGNPFYPQKIQTARYYVEQVLPRGVGHGQVVLNDSVALCGYAEEWL